MGTDVPGTDLVKIGAQRGTVFECNPPYELEISIGEVRYTPRKYPVIICRSPQADRTGAYGSPKEDYTWLTPPCGQTSLTSPRSETYAVGNRGIIRFMN
jgi:hypothetical protein